MRSLLLLRHLSSVLTDAVDRRVRTPSTAVERRRRRAHAAVDGVIRRQWEGSVKIFGLDTYPRLALANLTKHILQHLPCARIAYARRSCFSPTAHCNKSCNPVDLLEQLQHHRKPSITDHWLRKYCILSGGIFYLEPSCPNFSGSTFSVVASLCWN